MQKWYTDKRLKEILTRLQKNTEEALKQLTHDLEDKTKGTFELKMDPDHLGGTITTHDREVIDRELGTAKQPAKPVIRQTVLADEHAIVETVRKP